MMEWIIKEFWLVILVYCMCFFTRFSRYYRRSDIWCEKGYKSR